MPLLTELGNCLRPVLQRCRPYRGSGRRGIGICGFLSLDFFDRIVLGGRVGQVQLVGRQLPHPRRVRSPKPPPAIGSLVHQESPFVYSVALSLPSQFRVTCGSDLRLPSKTTRIENSNIRLNLFSLRAFLPV